MNSHTKEQFDIFMSQLKETNTTLGFYCDFEKINNNVESISIKLNQLNYLIGQMDMDAAIRRLWDENRNVFSILEILIAVRTSDKKKAIMADGNVKLINSLFDSVDGVIEYIHGTGLDEVFRNKQIKFTDIAKVTEKVLSYDWSKECETIEEVVQIDYEARNKAIESIKELNCQ